LTETAVALERCRQYEQRQLVHCLATVLAGIDLPCSPASARLVLKPNLIGLKRGPLACTEGRFLVTVARWFRDQGCKVTVGDSPAFGSATAILGRLGVERDLARMGVTISNFETGRRLRLGSGVRARLAREVLECDLLVNLPRVKAHAQMRVTLAVKNCFGCLTGLQKPWWHMVYGGAQGPFASLLVQLLAELPPILTLVDGIRAMHRTGPMGGDPFDLGLVAAGLNPVAVDTALLEVLGLETGDVPLQRAARDLGIAGARPEEVVYPLLEPRQVRARGFQVPKRLNPVRFSLLSFARSSLRRALGNGRR